MPLTIPVARLESFRRQREASVSVRSPSVKAAPTEDLRAELNRRRAGKDAPIYLERPDDLWGQNSTAGVRARTHESL
jgi:hypothetical protein